MAYDEIRIYGEIEGIGAEHDATLTAQFPEMRFTRAGRTVQLEFEGAFFFIEDYIEVLRPRLDADASGQIDYIDHHAWEMQRFRFQGNDCTCRTVNLNDVLERYNRE